MGIRVMIIDDSSVMRKIVARNVRMGMGDELDGLVEASDGVEALQALGQEAVDIVFCDVNMPNMSGIEFLRALRNSPNRDVPVVMVTTEADRDTVLNAKDLGVVGFILKPFSSDQFKAVLEQVSG